MQDLLNKIFVDPYGDLTPWELLHETKPLRSVITNIIDSWNELLNDTTKTEHDYHAFISENAGLFFGDPQRRFLTISKLKLGCDYETDFVIPYDSASLGFQYKLIEIQSPHDPLFTKDGKYSSALNEAINQIENWKRWANTHRDSLKQLLPSVYPLHADEEPNIDYVIIIGRRDGNPEHLNRRNHLNNKGDYTIRSYDHLTDGLKKRSFFSLASITQSEADELPRGVMNGLANPFYKSFSHSNWQSLLKARNYSTCHFIVNMAEAILSTRKHNIHLDSFQSSLEGLKEKVDLRQYSPLFNPPSAT